MKSIKTKILMVVCLLVSISLVIVGVSVCLLMYNSSLSQLEKTMTETANVSAQLVAEYLETYKAVATETGSLPSLSDSTLSNAEKKKVLDGKIEQHKFVGGSMVDAKGIGILSDVDISDRDYFKEAMSGKTAISDVVFGRVSNTYTINIASPVWKDGVPNSTIVGVVYFNVDAQRLSDITNRVQVGSTGSAYMIDKDNFTIAHKTITVADRDNTAESAKTDTQLNQLLALETKMRAGETGFGQYSYGGVNKILAYAPVGLNGWSLAVNANLSEFLQDTLTAIFITAILVVVAIIVGVAMSIRLANAITKPVKELDYLAKQLSEGKLDATISHQSKDELGSLANSMRSAMSTLSTYISDIDYSLTEFSNGNFDLREFTMPFIGDFEAIEKAINTSSASLSSTMTQIKVASDQVSSGSEQVSSGAQALSQGATEQASSIQELSATITEISGQVRNNAENAQNAKSKAVGAKSEVEISNNKMRDMIAAMDEISGKSGEIGKIIKTIEDIAFQTNILALNAAVEAARAGAAGKGFAVVADEVRNLASKSAEAAKNTTALIEETVSAVANGTNIANDTAQSMNIVVDGTTEIAGIIDLIAGASSEQASSISQVTQGVDQISSVVQTNSATAEESAAASEELSSQATMLNDLVARFKLKADSDNAQSYLG